MRDYQVPTQVLDVLAVALKVWQVINFGWLPIASSHMCASHAEHGGDHAANFADDESFRRHFAEDFVVRYGVAYFVQLCA
jgi:hypothetical protein